MKFEFGQKIIDTLRFKKRNNAPKIKFSDVDGYYLGFFGEFGYEMVSWLPYLTYLKQVKNLTFKTAGREGSSVFYKNISSEHIEISNEYIGDSFGEYDKICAIEEKYNIKLIAPSNEITPSDFLICGVSWDNKNIHDVIDTRHYATPVFDTQDNLEFLKDTGNYNGVLTINNKNHYNWNYTLVKNFFDESELFKLIDYFTQKNWLVIYNNPNKLFVEELSNYVDENYNLSHITNNFIDLNNIKFASIDERNKSQIECWQKSDLVIGVHGGSVYIPAILGKKQYVLMRKGDYIDFTELNRVFGADISCFYEVNQMLAYYEYASTRV